MFTLIIRLLFIVICYALRVEALRYGALLARSAKAVP